MVQNRTLNHTYLIPIIIFLALLLDGVLMNVFASQFISSQYVLTPRLLLLVLVLATIFFPKQPLFLYAMLFGFVYDSFYAGVLGIYVAGFAIIIYTLKKSQKHILVTPVVLFFIHILAVSFLELFVFGLYTVLGYANLGMIPFMTERLGPTLLLNIIFFIALYYPTYKLSQWMYE